MESIKLCIDCKHFVANIRSCQHPILGISLVDGKPKTDSPSFMRLNFSYCKEEALLFEPQEAVIYDLADLFPEAPFPSLERTTK